MLHFFEFKGQYILLDVESGAVHAIDKITYDVLCATQKYGRQGAPQILGDAYSEKEIQEVFGELDELAGSGALYSEEQQYSPMRGQSVVKAMCLHVAHDCNLRCEYCFAGKGEYNGEKALMPLEVGKKALDFLIEKSGGRKHLEVDFFGGEPLMNFEVVKQLVAYGRELERASGKSIAFTMTTNGLAIDDEVIEFCAKEINNVVLSLDGRKAVHDRLRRTPNGNGSFDLVWPKIKRFALARQQANQSYYVRGTFTKENLDFLEDVKFLAENGIEQISVEPVVLPQDNPLALGAQDLPRIFEEYDKLALYSQESRESGNWFNFFHFMVDLEGGPCISKRMSGCGAGSEYVAITPSGDIFPCHQFAGKTDHKMGNVLTGEFDDVVQAAYRACNICSKPVCRDCWCKYYCSGGCMANAIEHTGSINEPYPLACQMQKKRTECALGLYVSERAQKAQ